jgi:TatD DNase family protein
MWFDTHVHLNDSVYDDRLEAVIEDAKANGVSRFMVIGWDRASSERAIEIAQTHPEVYAAIGFHPSEAGKVFEDDFAWLKAHAKAPKVVAIGEIGLDYYRGKETMNEQKILFEAQIEIALAHDLPIAIHMRDATLDVLNTLKRYRTHTLRGVMHCYSGSASSALEFIQLNMYIALGGPVTFHNAKTPKEVAEKMDLSHLVLETDAPYLAPMPFRGKLNEPKYLPLIADEIADIKGVSRQELARITTHNACRLLNIEIESTSQHGRI